MITQSNFNLIVRHSRGEKSQNLARHMALVHNKLDELLADKELVAARRLEQQVTRLFEYCVYH